MGEEKEQRRGEVWEAGEKAEGNIWLGAARASSRLIGLLRGHTHLVHQSPGPLFPKVGLRAQGFSSAAPLMTAPVKKTIPHLVSCINLAMSLSLTPALIKMESGLKPRT